MRTATSRAGSVITLMGATALASGVVMGMSGASYAASSPSPSPSSSPSSTSAMTAPNGCPPAPPGQDKTDHGFFTIGPALSGSTSSEVRVRQPFTVKLFCYDPEVQHATISFTGADGTGNGIAVPITQGPASFVFTGNQDVTKLDAEHTYTLNLSVLGAPAADGWHLSARIDIAEDKSANRTVPFRIVPAAKPTPSPSPSPSVTPSVSPTASHRPSPKPTSTVLGEKVTRTPTSTLPFTGAGRAAALGAAGVVLLVMGGLAQVAGRRRRS